MFVKLKNIKCVQIVSLPIWSFQYSHKTAQHKNCYSIAIPVT